jgi:hypothetical protein
VRERRLDPDRIETPDVEIGAAAKAKRLRFKRSPETNVEVHGELRETGRRKLREPGERELRDELRSWEVETASGSERQNLPDEVEPGVTYRDVSVRWRAAARLRRKPDQPDSNEA